MYYSSRVLVYAAGNKAAHYRPRLAASTWHRQRLAYWEEEELDSIASKRRPAQQRCYSSHKQPGITAQHLGASRGRRAAAAKAVEAGQDGGTSGDAEEQQAADVKRKGQQGQGGAAKKSKNK